MRFVRQIPIPIETRSLPALARSYPRHFTFYVANPISSIASRPHCKHLPEMIPGFGAGLVIPDLWQQEAVRALQRKLRDGLFRLVDVAFITAENPQLQFYAS